MNFSLRVVLSVASTMTLPVLASERAEVSREPRSEANTPWVVPHLVEPNFSREDAYIEKRRRAAGVKGQDRTIAICLSGGGLRSATINLGVLQGLEECGLLRKADYLSAVSGGAYVGAWYVAHLLPAGTPPVKEENKGTSLHREVYAYQSTRRALLELDPPPPQFSPGPVQGLADRRGFVLGRGNWRIPELIFEYAWRLPVNAVVDVALHFKPTRGKFNWHHISFPYQRAIERTYLTPPESVLPGQVDPAGFFRGKPHPVTLSEINPDGSEAPYLVLGAALANGRSDDPGGPSSVLPFEFSRHSVGAPFLGYIAAEHFGFTVTGDLPEAEKLEFPPAAQPAPETAAGKKAQAKLEAQAAQRPDVVPSGRQTTQRANSQALLPWHTTKPIKLASAVAASGAALDSAGLSLSKKSRVILLDDKATGRRVPVIPNNRPFFDTFLTPLNLNLRYTNRNFAMKPGGTPQSPWSVPQRARDRAREVTVDRIDPKMESNTLYLSDGGHYDNLGITAMLRRASVSEIWAFDATQDGAYKFGDLARVEEIIYREGWKILDSKGWRQEFDTLQGPASKSREETKSRIWTRSPVFSCTLQKFDHQPVKLYYVKSSYRVTDGEGMKTLNYERHEGGKSVREFLADYSGAQFRGSNATARKFPHTGTANVSFNHADFHAYREMGRVLAHKLGQELSGE